MKIFSTAIMKMIIQLITEDMKKLQHPFLLLKEKIYQELPRRWKRHYERFGN
jgi:hypothetical protein